MIDEQGNSIEEGVEALAKQIEKTAKLQHLTGQRREVFTDSVSLCSTCRWSSSRRRASRNTRRLECSYFSGPCPEDISECSEYATLTSLTLAQMAEMATLIGGKDKKVGFQPD